MAPPKTAAPPFRSAFPLLALLAVLVSLFSRPAVQLYAFRNTDRVASLTRYANSSSINSDHCAVNYDANACEDVVVHFASSTAFIACGNPAERVHWYPPSCAHNAAARSEDSFQEDLFKYDIKKQRTTKLRIEGLSGDFINHGVDVYGLPEDPTKVNIFAVNHGRGGDSIMIFSHVIGSDSVQLVRQARHPGIKTANGVAAVSSFGFFITNDHYFAGGILRKIEDFFGPWPWATDVQYCDASGDATVCHRVSERHPGFNGIAVSKDKKTLFVGDSKIGVLTIFNITEDKSLIKANSIPLGGAADNIRLLPNNGDIIISIFPTLEDLPLYKANVHSLGKDLLVPTAALRLRKENGYTPELVYKGDGSGISYMTVAAIDPNNRVLIAGGVLQYGGFAVCNLDEKTLV